MKSLGGGGGGCLMMGLGLDFKGDEAVFFNLAMS